VAGYTYDNAFTNTTFAWSNVAAHGVLSVTFAENLWDYDTPELWLLAYYPGTTDFNAAALDDTDQDGMAAWQEYVAGTTPTNPASVLRIVELRPAGGSQIAVAWSSVSNKTYALNQTTNLGIPWTASLTNIRATSSLNVSTADTGQAGCTFYRITVSP
jgi:hypothetical protein